MAASRSMGPKKKNDGTVQKIQDETFVCPHCGNTKKRSAFYVSRDPAVVIGIAFPCKECAEKIARNYNPKTGEYGDVSPASLQRACEYLDIPYIQKVWDSSVSQVHDETHERPKTNVWRGYVTQINSLKQYAGMRWRDGDVFKEKTAEVHTEVAITPQNPQVLEECERNKKDVIKLIGYDPFDKEAEEDKPLLYAQLRGYLDADGNNDDQTRVLDCIEIVRGYLQLQKVNDMSARAFANLGATGQSGEIKNYMDTKKKIADVISQLAEQSCISMKHNKNAKKGENTWTGKIKKIRDLNLRECEVNGFDIGTCRGMQQVLELSDASIMKQLALDESEWSDMVAEQRSKIVKLQSERDVYKEINRILLRENIDLRDTLADNDLLDESNLQSLKQLFSAFGDLSAGDSVDVDEPESTIEEVSSDE